MTYIPISRLVLKLSEIDILASSNDAQRKGIGEEWVFKALLPMLTKYFLTGFKRRKTFICPFFANAMLCVRHFYGLGMSHQSEVIVSNSEMSIVSPDVANAAIDNTFKEQVLFQRSIRRKPFDDPEFQAEVEKSKALKSRIDFQSKSLDGRVIDWEILPTRFYTDEEKASIIEKLFNARSIDDLDEIPLDGCFSFLDTRCIVFYNPFVHKWLNIAKNLMVNSEKRINLFSPDIDAT